MPETWGNDNLGKFNEDLVSDTANTNILKVNDVNDDDDDKIAIHAINSSTGAGARALKIEGRAQLIANTLENESTEGAEIVNTNSNPGSRALLVLGPTRMGRVNPESILLDISNDSADENARALKVEGKSEFIGPDPNDPPVDSLKISYLSSNVNANALKVDGQTDLVGPGQDQGSPPSVTLKVLNWSTHPDSLAISAYGGIQMDGVLIADGLVNGIRLTDGNRIETDGLMLFDRRIDAEPLGPGQPQDLRIGGGLTGNVRIGHDPGLTLVLGTFRVEGGDIPNMQVGRIDTSGTIDSGGDAATPQVLKIGRNTGTDNLELGRSGKNVDMKADTRMNSNELIMDGKASLATGSGFVYNATGSGSMGESIDVFIGGTKVGYWDSAGWH